MQIELAKNAVAAVATFSLALSCSPVFAELKATAPRTD
jgi:hypothetical protein